MSKLELKRRLLALTVIFTASLLFGCGGKQVVVIEDTFTPEYYLLKKYEPSDYERVNKMTTSENIYYRNAANLIIGFYDMKYNNDIDSASYRIKRYYKDANLSPYMKNMGLLFSMETYLAKGDYDNASIQARKIKENIGEQDYDKALRSYCYQYDLVPDSINGSYGCVITRLGEHYTTASDNKTATVLDNEEGFVPFPYEYMPEFKEVLNILVVSKQNSIDAGGGIFYLSSLNHLPHKIKVVTNQIDGDWDYIFDLDNRKVIILEPAMHWRIIEKEMIKAEAAGELLTDSNIARVADFKPELSDYVVLLSHYGDLLKCNRVLLSASSKDAAVVKTFYEELDNKSLTEIVHIPHYIGGGFNELRGKLTEWELLPFCVVGIGSEEENNEFVTFAKQYQRNPVDQKIFMLQETLTGKYLTNNYRGYYMNTYISPAADIFLNENSGEIRSAYIDYSGREPIYETFLGYDMLNYVLGLRAGDTESVEYLTQIIGFDQFIAVRPFQLYYLSTKGVEAIK